uniref:Uncharacterized protein n=1 Tax=Panagrolaimus davidi TaxID=227884 RepID=A0A914QLK3_9BILA
MPRQISLSPRQQKTVESEPKDDIDLSAARMEFEDDNSGTNSQELSFLKPIDNGTGTFSLFSPSPSPEAKKSGDNSGFLF